MSNRLPAVLGPGTPATAADTFVVPWLVAIAGDLAAWRYIDFSSAAIRNRTLTGAYVQACRRFFAWCEARGLPLGQHCRPFRTENGQLWVLS